MFYFGAGLDHNPYPGTFNGIFTIVRRASCKGLYPMPWTMTTMLGMLGNELLGRGLSSSHTVVVSAKMYEFVYAF